jgi:hypothetical protein
LRKTVEIKAENAFDFVLVFLVDYAVKNVSGMQFLNFDEPVFGPLTHLLRKMLLLLYL